MKWWHWLAIIAAAFLYGYCIVGGLYYLVHTF